MKAERINFKTLKHGFLRTISVCIIAAIIMVAFDVWEDKSWIVYGTFIFSLLYWTYKSYEKKG